MQVSAKDERLFSNVEQSSERAAARSEGEEREFETASAAIASRTFSGLALVYAKRAFYLSAINFVLLIILILRG